MNTGKSQDASKIGPHICMHINAQIIMKNTESEPQWCGELGSE